jgi:very-short-patch-repair endonuclease
MASPRARALRNNPTDAEKRLWRHLRQRQLGGHRFRRQVPIGPYVADFVCLEQRLIIEVDGGQHAVEAARDEIRTAWLESQRFSVVRFWNNDVLGNTEGVLEVIKRELERAHPPPQPSPARGERDGVALKIFSPPARGGKVGRG